MVDPAVLLTSTSPAGSYLHWGVVSISRTNALIVLAMVVVFVLAIALPYPRPRSEDEERQSRSDS